MVLRLVSLSTMGLLVVGQVHSVDSIDIDHAPAFLLKGAPPNLIMTLDDSGSMNNANSTREGLINYDASDTASISNRQYYDPEIVYLPPLRGDGTMFPHASFAEAPRDFFRNEFCRGCQDQLLDGALTGKTCAELCPQDIDRACVLDLSTDYAPVFGDRSNACQTRVNGLFVGRYALDPYLLDSVFLAQVAAAPTEEQRFGLFVQKSDKQALACMHGLPNGSTNCPAFYHRFLESATFIGPDGQAHSCTESTAIDAGFSHRAERASWVANCLERVVVGSVEDLQHTTAEAKARRVDLLGGYGETDVELAQRNFANWYAYYRNRWFALQSAVSRAIAGLDQSIRVAYQPLVDEELAASDPFFQTQLFGPFGEFDEPRRTSFVRWLSSQSAGGETPLLASAVRAHNFCSERRAYLEDPQVSEGPENNLRACRNQFHLIMTDGRWDDDERANFLVPNWLENNDGTAQTLPYGADSLAEQWGILRYPADASTAVFRDDNAKGLADIVFHSWVSDLLPGEDDLVRTLISDPAIPDGEDESYVFWNPANDPADWQHITTFTIGFGVIGEVTYPAGDYAGSENVFTNGFPGSWTAFSDADSPNAVERVDDLWHAGINGRGGYRLASDPQALTDAFVTIFQTISEAAKQKASNAAPAINGGSAGTTRYVFQATFNSEHWSGDVRAYRVSGGRGVEPCPNADKPRGALCEEPGTSYFWSAAEELDDPAFLWSMRKLATSTVAYSGDGTKSNVGIAFGSGNWDSISDNDKRALVGLARAAGPLPADDSIESLEAQAVMDFIAGDRSHEIQMRQDDDPLRFRDRESLLGDIINGGAVVVSAPHRSFNDPKYLAFARANANRDEIVYVGANDGILHGLKLATGVEVFGYVPRSLFGKLAVLTEPGYGSNPQHTNFVDGPIAEGDAYFREKDKWQSVVVGAMGLGSQGVYAIRSPSLNEGTDLDVSKIHLWDFTDRDDADLGYVFGKPAIVRVKMKDGSIRWVAVFGNGYNSSEDDGYRASGCDDVNQDTGPTACGRAVLYVVDIETGALVAKYDTGTGRVADPLHAGSEKEPNGLAEPRVVSRVLTDENGDQIGGGDPVATVVYAGDLYGNLWRFDLYELDGSSTVVGRSPTLVFSASAGSVAQPITAGVELASHPTGVGVLVLFGTGRYLSLSDSTDTSLNTFYGIWDKGEAGSPGQPLVTADQLLNQHILNTGLRVDPGDTDDGSRSTTETLGRTSTRFPIDWAQHSGWRLDLIEIENNEKKGERVIFSPELRGNRIVFVSVIPETNPCSQGGLSWINAVSFSSGSALDQTPFDYDLNGLFDIEDKLVTDAEDDGLAIGTSIRGKGGGIYSSPGSLVLSGGETKTVVSTSEGEIFEVMESSVLDWRVWRQLQ